MKIFGCPTMILATGFLAACAATGANTDDDPLRRLISGTCPDAAVMTVAAPNMYWEPVAGGEVPAGWCEHHVFRHKTRLAAIGVGLLPSPRDALEFADAFAAGRPVYDIHTGEGELMDRDRADDGRSWAFVHLQVPGANGPDRIFTAFLKYDELPGHVVIVTGLWPASDNQGLIFDLTDLVKGIGFRAE